MEPWLLAKLTVPNNVPTHRVADAHPRDRSGENSMDTVKIRRLLNREGWDVSVVSERLALTRNEAIRDAKKCGALMKRAADLSG
jgi:predicted secreted protein